MKGLTGALVGLALLLGTSPAFAEMNFGNDGRLYHTSIYDGPPVGIEDVAALTAIVTGRLMTNYDRLLDWGTGLMSTTFITWGAWRTAKYRPQSSKDAIQTILKARCEKVNEPGQVHSILAPTGC